MIKQKEIEFSFWKALEFTIVELKCWPPIKRIATMNSSLNSPAWIATSAIPRASPPADRVPIARLKPLLRDAPMEEKKQWSYEMTKCEYNKEFQIRTPSKLCTKDKISSGLQLSLSAISRVKSMTLINYTLPFSQRRICTKSFRSFFQRKMYLKQFSSSKRGYTQSRLNNFTKVYIFSNLNV